MPPALLGDFAFARPPAVCAGKDREDKPPSLKHVSSCAFRSPDVQASFPAGGSIADPIQDTQDRGQPLSCTQIKRLPDSRVAPAR